MMALPGRNEGHVGYADREHPSAFRVGETRRGRGSGAILSVIRGRRLRCASRRRLGEVSLREILTVSDAFVSEVRQRPGVGRRQ